MKLYTFRAVPLPIIRSLFTVHSTMVYVVQVCRQLTSRTILVLLVGFIIKKVFNVFHTILFLADCACANHSLSMLNAHSGDVVQDSPARVTVHPVHVHCNRSTDVSTDVRTRISKCKIYVFTDILNVVVQDAC